MKILFVTDYFPPECNAAATRVYERAVYWVKDGHDVTVITSAPNFPEGKLFGGYVNRWYQVATVDGIRVVRVKTFMAPNRGIVLRMLDFLSFGIASIFAGCVQPRPDVVTATSPQFFAGLSGAVLSIAHRRPFVLEVSDLWGASVVGTGLMKRNYALRLAEWIELSLCRRAAAVITLSERIKVALMKRGVRTENIVAITNGADPARYRPMPKDKEMLAAHGLTGAFVAGYIGTHGSAQALEHVIEAAARLRDVPDIRFLFVGAGACRERLIRTAKDLGLSNVIFVPEQPKEAIARYWSICDVSIIHLRDAAVFATAIPSKMFEALAMGLPVVIAAPDGDAVEIVRKEDVGLVVPAGQPQALADAILHLKMNPALCEQFSLNSARAATRHTRETQARRVLDVYEFAAGFENRAHGVPEMT